MEIITNRLDQAGEKILRIKDKVELLHSDSNSEKISNHDQNIQTSGIQLRHHT
jgi:hypothetical protein